MTTPNEKTQVGKYPKESFRVTSENVRMLARARRDAEAGGKKFNKSEIVNAALHKHLTELGYARKKEAAV